MILGYFQNLLESVIIISLFCTLYIAVFQKETTHKQNRLFLLFGIVLSLTLPFLEIYNPINMPTLETITLNEVIIIRSNNITAEQTTNYSFINVLFSIYIIGTIFFIIRFILQAIKINSFLKDSKVLKNNKVKIVYTNKKHSPFSFLNFIFIDKETQNSKNAEVILKHETVHVLQRHSIDLILFELLLIIQWFNPLVWIYGKKIKENHEFTVDNELIKNGLDSVEYQQILLSTNSSNYLFFTNNFNKSLTFKRLIMMTKNKSSKAAILKLIAILPILLASVYLISCSENNKDTTNKEQVNKIDNEIKKEITSGTVKKEEIVENSKISNSIPEGFRITYSISNYKEFKKKDNPNDPLSKITGLKFPGGKSALKEYLKKNIEYPEEAQKKGIQGRVIVNFSVEHDGSVSNIKIVKGVSKYLDKEAIRVVKTMPKWIRNNNEYAKMSVNMPINFTLR